MNVLASRELVVSTLGLDEESVGTEVVTLSLEQVGGKIARPVAVVEAEGGAESRSGDTPGSTLADNRAPSGLGLVDGSVEEGIEEQVVEVWVVAVGICDLLEEDRADDAATTPHKGNAGLVQGPVVFLGGL